MASSLFSGEDTITPQTLMNSEDDDLGQRTDDGASISSSGSLSSVPTQAEPVYACTGDKPVLEGNKKSTLTRDEEASRALVGAASHQKVPPPTAPKPVLAAKPVLVRPGLKPVKIPKVEEKSQVKNTTRLRHKRRDFVSFPLPADNTNYESQRCNRFFFSLCAPFVGKRTRIKTI